MKLATRLTSATAATVAALAITAAPAAHAQGNSIVVSNSAGTVNCQIYDDLDATRTICASQIARDARPECNERERTTPAISIDPANVGTACWIEHYYTPAERRGPLQVRLHGSTVVIPDFAGNLYVFDFRQFAGVRVGATLDVLFGRR